MFVDRCPRGTVNVGRGFGRGHVREGQQEVDEDGGEIIRRADVGVDSTQLENAADVKQ